MIPTTHQKKEFSSIVRNSVFDVLCEGGGGWSSWSEGVCSENRQGQRVSEDSRICTTPDHPECCLGLSTRTSPCPGVPFSRITMLEYIYL